MTQCLLEQGVDTVFGYPGSTVLDIYDEIYLCGRRLKHILTSHEQAAAHAADGYARISGKPGVCIATSGPGATNLVTGIAAAYMDSSPVVFITGNVAEDRIGKDSFQEVDITGIAMPITKSTYLVRSAEKLPHVMRQAFAVACGGRPGPVLIDILSSVTNKRVRGEYEPAEPVRIPAAPAAQTDVDTFAGMAAKASKPLILAGGGVIRSGAADDLVRLARKLSAPVCTTLMGLGIAEADDPINMGMAGMHGTYAARTLLNECDMLVAVGVRFSDRLAPDPEKFAPSARIVHIDIDRAEIEKNVRADHYIVADASLALRQLCEALPRKDCPEWMEHARRLRARTERKSPAARAIIEEIARQTDKDAIIATDVGQHQLWTCQYYPFSRPGQLVTSGGYGAMGFGLSAAVGAQIAAKDRRVIHITGDGSFRMNCGELATTAAYGLPVVTVILNNGVLGMVRQWQTLLYNGRYSQTNLDRGPDFSALARAYGVGAYKAEDLQEFKTAFSDALGCGKAAVIDCRIPEDDMVAPSFFGPDFTDITSEV